MAGSNENWSKAAKSTAGLLEKAYEERDRNLAWTLADVPPTRSTARRAQLNPKSDDLKRLRDDIDKELLSLAVP